MGNNTSVHIAPPLEKSINNDEQINFSSCSKTKPKDTTNKPSSSTYMDNSNIKEQQQTRVISSTPNNIFADFDDFAEKASEIKLLIMKSNSAAVLSSKLQDCFSQVSSCQPSSLQLRDSRSSLMQLQKMYETMMTCADAVVQFRDMFSVALTLLRTMNGVYSTINNILVCGCKQNNGSPDNYEEIKKKWSSWSS